MGQGTYTGLATILADELDADWQHVRVEGAAADAKRYNNTFWGPTQGTGGSTAMANSWDQMRQAGAAGRAMLVSAAAKRWKVGAADIVVRDSVVSHAASGRQASFGELALDAANETVPAEVKLKDPKDFRLIAKQTGDADKAFAGAAKVVSAAFDFPYLAHAAMEPMNCVVHLKADGCELWNGEQFQTVDQGRVAALFNLKPEQVKINMLYAGGSFGRRASTQSDYVMEAAHIVKAINGRAPVKLVWLREDDMRAGYYRPLFHHALEAAVDGSGKLVGWRHRLVGQSIMAGSPFESMMIKDGVDHVSVEGASNLPYAIPNLTVDLHTPTDIPVPVLWWRSVGSSHTAYSTEVFLDQVAAAMGKDPVALRLELLGEHPRHAGVLKLAAEKANWGTPLKAAAGERRGRGVAVHESFNSFVAQVAEVTVKKDGSIKVDRIICAVDCGTAINPDNIRSQVEGAVGFALSAALSGEITLKEGRVEQGNFDGYPLLRIGDMPAVEVHIVPSTSAPTGIGEPGVPPLAPAVANAIAAATGKFLHKMPFNSAELVA
ncbi:MAG: molybdopterin cofactor-binding domain-containing protein [Azonexus sp.]|nr:molybdopterin cofactor-binding domain-containing protein [Azonexus sp.]